MIKVRVIVYHGGRVNGTITSNKPEEAMKLKELFPEEKEILVDTGKISKHKVGHREDGIGFGHDYFLGMGR